MYKIMITNYVQSFDKGRRSPKRKLTLLDKVGRMCANTHYKHQNFQSKIVGVLPFSKLRLFNENTGVFMKTQYYTSV